MANKGRFYRSAVDYEFTIPTASADGSINKNITIPPHARVMLDSKLGHRYVIAGYLVDDERELLVDVQADPGETTVTIVESPDNGTYVAATQEDVIEDMLDDEFAPVDWKSEVKELNSAEFVAYAENHADMIHELIDYEKETKNRKGVLRELTDAD